MKCSFCTYAHKPENPFMLKAHVEQDILDGLTRGIVPVVVWRDGEFVMIERAEDGEQLYDMGIIDPRPIIKEDLLFETIEED